MSNFEEWFLSNGIPLDTDFNVAKRAFEAGQQSQQAKIDELQGRIDDALNTLCKLQYSSGERIYNDVGSILKGNKDEN